MSCKSGIYAVNTTVGTAIALGSVYPATSIIRRYGQYVDIANGGILLKGAGYYDVDIVANATATAIGNIVATLYQDGVAVPGATVTVTATAIGDEVSLPISALVRVVGCCTNSVLTVVISGQAVGTNNLAFKVEKE